MRDASGKESTVASAAQGTAGSTAGSTADSEATSKAASKAASKASSSGGRPASRWRVGTLAAAAALLLLAPLVAMQVTGEVRWGAEDFLAFGALLGGAGFAYELAARRTADIAYRAGVGVAIAAGCLIVWIALAVGIIGEPGDPADLMYAGVLAVGAIGAVVSRFRPRGMATVLLTTALAQALVAVIALVAGKHQSPISSAAEILGLNGIFVALMLVSAWLFHRAAGVGRTHSSSGD